MQITEAWEDMGAMGRCRLTYGNEICFNTQQHQVKVLVLAMYNCNKSKSPITKCTTATRPSY